MPAFVALLRAVNLGPHNKVSMADLKALAERVKLTEARTLLQSGNLLFQTKAQASSALEKTLEGALTKELGLTTPVLVRSAGEWQAAVAANPFPQEAKADPSHLVIMPLKAKPTKDGLKALEAAIVGRERVKLVRQELYLVYPDGIGVSKLTIQLVERKLGTTGTGRNWNTALKIAALLGA